MGMFKLFSSGGCSFDPPKPPNPNPDRFIIVKTKQWGKFLIALINYPGCTTYEGKKVLVFENISARELKSRYSIDPHFTENKDSPIARFPGNNQGFKDALTFVKIKEFNNGNQSRP